MDSKNSAEAAAAAAASAAGGEPAVELNKGAASCSEPEAASRVTCIDDLSTESKEKRSRRCEQLAASSDPKCPPECAPLESNQPVAQQAPLWPPPEEAHSAALSQAPAAPTTSQLIGPPRNAHERKSVLFDTVTVYHFTRSQGFSSIPSQGGSTLGMKRKHFLRRKLSVDLYEEVRRRSRREILLKIKLDKHKAESEDCQQIHCNSASSSTSSSSTTSNTTSSDSDDESFSEYSDISDSELESDSFVFCQPIGVKLRRSLLRASGVGRIDPKEKRECRVIRESRDRSGCNCVNQCIPGLCECSLLGVNCHVDRVSFPCGCVSAGCRNPLGRTEFDIKRVKQHHFQTLFKSELNEVGAHR